jgi:protein phosphatase 2C family protein 2/3
VSRSFGDIEAKNPKYGGNNKVLIADPDIFCFEILSNYDFVVIGCKSFS